jgi:hypothetical protein
VRPEVEGVEETDDGEFSLWVKVVEISQMIALLQANEIEPCIDNL